MSEIDPLLAPLKIIFDYMDGNINLEEATEGVKMADPEMSYCEIKSLLLSTPRDNVVSIQEPQSKKEPPCKF